jgi:hypothetical protein
MTTIRYLGILIASQVPIPAVTIFADLFFTNAPKRASTLDEVLSRLSTVEKSDRFGLDDDQRGAQN